MLKTSGYEVKDVIYGSVDILKYRNVEILKSNKTITLTGNWFVVDATEQAYYHFLFDHVGQYYALRSIVPNLKLVVRTPRHVDLLDYVSWCIDKLSLENEVIHVYDDDSLFIENLYVASNRLIPLFRLIEDDLFDLVVKDEYQDIVVPALRDFLLRNLPKRDKSEKLYAIRRDKSKELLARLEYLDYLKSNGVTWDNGDIQDPKNILENIPQKFKQGWVSRIINNRLTSVEMDTTTRHISEEDETMLEQFFLDNGYTLFSHLDMSYEDQMAMIASCKSYACITGASALNAIVCPEDASIYIVNPDTSWPMPNHEYAASFVSNNAHTVFKIRDYPNQKFTMQQVIGRLKEIV